MAIYKYGPGNESIIVEATGTQIPLDPLNIDYQNYLQWAGDGNITDPADVIPPSPPAPPPTSLASLDIQAQALLATLAQLLNVNMQTVATDYATNYALALAGQLSFPSPPGQ